MGIPNKGARAFALVLLLPVATALFAQADPAETRKLHDLFDADWQWSMRTWRSSSTKCDFAGI